MGMAEANTWRELKDMHKWARIAAIDANASAAALLQEQQRTNALLEQLIQVMQGQPRMSATPDTHRPGSNDQHSPFCNFAHDPLTSECRSLQGAKVPGQPALERR